MKLQATVRGTEEKTINGTERTGLKAVLATLNGAIIINIKNGGCGKSYVKIMEMPYEGKGKRMKIHEGYIGRPQEVK